MLAVEIKSIENINKYDCDIIIIPTIFSSSKNSLKVDFSLMKTNKKIALNVDKIIEEDEIESLKEFLKGTLLWNVDYYFFSDMSVYYILNSYGVQNKFVLCSKTLCCSVNDIKEYNKLGIQCLVSTELTLQNIIDISNINNNAFLIYGYSNIFYSKRKLITLFEKQFNYKSNKSDCYIVEETRKEKYPITETKNGTFIYTPYRYYLFEEMKQIDKNNIFIIASDLLTEDEVLKVSKIYYRSFENNFNNKYLIKLKNLNDNINHHFLYIRPSILKETNNE